MHKCGISGKKRLTIETKFSFFVNRIDNCLHICTLQIQIKLVIMRNLIPLIIAFLCVCFIQSPLLAQEAVTIKGNVKNATSGETVSSVSVVIKGTDEGTYTDDRGNFSLSTRRPLPITLVFSSIGFEMVEKVVSSANQEVSVSMATATSLGQEVVVSATRMPSRILESPVSIERVSNTAIKTAPAANYYDLLVNLKGVDFVTSSLTFKTPTTRGFAGSGNARFLQIMDGMDNQAPGLNFSVGSVIGLTELDVESVELLQGASSALYGPGGMNGTMFINAKNPFKYQGLSFQIKTGLMHLNSKTRDVSPYHNWAVRWAKQVNDKFAFKIGSELIQARDWVADDERNYRRFSGSSGEIIPGTRDTDPNFDGVNVYGDETTTNLRAVLNQIGGAVPPLQDYINALPSTINVSRTGYREVDIIDPNTKVFKLSGALHYKIKPNLEAVVAGHWGTGNSVYTGAQRYSLREFKIGQYKVELNAKNWFFRAFTTQENSGESHDLTVTTRLFNEQWKPSTSWYPEYAFAYLNAKMAGQNDLAAHNIARGAADAGRPAPRSEQFRQIYDRIRKVPIPQGGLFLDRSDMYWVEGQMNLSGLAGWKWADVLVGGNYRQFRLNSQGTLFMKEAEIININEVGMYAQIAKDIIQDKLRLTASGRYDKNENFEGRFTPRVTMLFKPTQNNNIRLSYQTAYRFPTTQQQWIDLFVGTGRLIGENRALWEKYNLIENAPYNPLNLSERLTYQQTRPESVTSFELGYKALWGSKFLFDAYGYLGEYTDFLTRRDAVQFATGVPSQTGSFTGFSIVANAPQKVTTYGWGVSMDYILPKRYRVGFNASSDVLENVPEGFRAFFNAPKLRTNVSFSKDGFGKKQTVGFNLVWRWQDELFYESDFVQGQLQAFHVVDASVNFRVPKIKSLVKVGANNLLNSYYRTAVANPSIGGLYYVSFAYNVL
jgi:outer membrane receptor protein involved in Fe transport